jgi:hypothetical protein
LSALLSASSRRFAVSSSEKVSDMPMPPDKVKKVTYHQLPPTPSAPVQFLTGTSRDRDYASASVAVGRVASNWAFFEHMLDELLWWLCDLDAQRGACLTSQMGSSYNRLLAIEALIRLRGASAGQQATLQKIASKWHGLNERRNRVVHDPLVWNENDNKIAAYRISTKKGSDLNFAVENIDLADYFALSESINEFTGVFHVWSTSLREELPSFL